MRTPEDILAAQATYNNLLVETELSALPEGYVAGGSIEIIDSDVFVAPLIANIRGKRITKPISTNIADMKWLVIKRNETYFHIYLNRYGFWFVGNDEPVTVDGLYGLYHAESEELYMGSVYIDDAGAFTEVISWKKIRTEDLDAGAITADKIEAGTITTENLTVGISGTEHIQALAPNLVYLVDTWKDSDTDIYHSASGGDISTSKGGADSSVTTFDASYGGSDSSVSTFANTWGNLSAIYGWRVSDYQWGQVTNIKPGVIETGFLEASQAVIIGYAGTGTNSVPDEGDRRTYIDEDEVGLEEYTGGAWTTINSVKLGGSDSNGNFYPFLQCRGLVNPLADGINTEFFPSSDFRVFNFEGNYEDQHGVDDWIFKSGIAINTTYKKFGTRSFGATPGDLAHLGSAEEWTLGKSQAMGVYVYITSFGVTSNIFRLYGDLDNYMNVRINHTTGTFDLLMEKGSTVTTLDSGISCTLDSWHYLALVYDSTNNEISLSVDNTIVKTNPSGTWGVGSSPYIQVTARDITSIYYTDEFIFAPDQYVNPGIWVQHYNHNVPWDTDASIKDIVLKPAEGGRVLLDTGVKSHYAHLTQTTQQNLGGANGTVKYIDWDGSQLNLDSSFTHSTGTNPSRITVNATGRYSLVWMVSGTQGGAGRTTLMSHYRINGITVVTRGRQRNYTRGSNYGDVSIGMTTELDLTSGQYIEVATTVDDTDATYTINTIVAECELIMRRIG